MVAESIVSRKMNRVLKIFLLSGVFFVSLVAVIGALFVYYVVPSRNNISCIDESRIIAQNKRGDKVELKNTVCNGIANSAVVDLTFLSNSNSTSETFFSYDRGNAEPDVSWDGDNVIVVNISDVAMVNKQSSTVAGLRIRYRIGKIQYH
jgi:uncharacterized protein YkvS